MSDATRARRPAADCVGLLNKQAAAELAISEITVQIHRGRIMKKMRAGSLAELVRIAGKLKIPLCPPR